MAAALVLLAGTAGVLGATRSDGHQDLVPVDRPTPSQTSGTPSPRVSPTQIPRPSAQIETLESQPMTAAQIRRDTKSCTTPVSNDPDPEPRRGTLRPTYAFVQLLVTTSTSPVDQRVLFVRDDAGQFECVDGQERVWSALPVSSFEPTAKIPAGESPNGLSGSASCRSAADATVESDLLFQVDPKRVGAARVTLVSDGQVVRLADVAVNGPTLYVGVSLSGAAAQMPMSFRVQLVDDRGQVVKVQPYGEAGAKPTDGLSYGMESCAEATARVDRHRSKALPIPSSDKAGLASCLKLARTESDGDPGLDPDKTKAEVSVSSPAEWGAVLSDGTYELGCSLNPTKEISATRTVTSNPSTTREAFSWAHQSIDAGGESLWASGHLPGATRIIYQLPDGTDATATISSGGFWRVMARTATAFDTAENAADWKPVTVTVTRLGKTTTYTIPWNVATQCHQISHGC